MTPSAFKSLRKLDRPLQERISEAIDRLAHDPRPANQSRKLAGSRTEYRIRVGSYRIVYEINDNVLLILVLRLGHRRDVYR